MFADSFLMPSSMKSSVRLAEECLENDKANEHEFSNVPNYESLQELACTFEASLYFTAIEFLALQHYHFRFYNSMALLIFCFFVISVFTNTRATIVGATVCFEHIHDKYTTIFELKIEKLVLSFL